MSAEGRGRIEILGGFSVFRDGREVDDLKSRPTCCALLAVVATEGRITRDQAALLLWPESDSRRARHALSQTIYQLRRILGHEWVLSHGQELRLGEGIEVDARQAAEALEQGDSDRALEAGTGRFLDGWHLRDTEPFEEWTHRKDLQHRTLFRDAARHRIARALDTDDLDDLVATARRWVEVEPSLEEANLHLLRGLVQLGEARSALDAYEVYARSLAEVGGVPGAELASLVARAEADLGASPPHGAGRPDAPHRVLVLPFAHAGPDELAHLTGGLTDEITVHLSGDSGLAVIARPSALRIDRAGRTLVEIGRALEVDSVVEGRVRWRVEGTRSIPRTSVQHVRVSDGSQLWAADLEAPTDRGETHGTAVVRRVRRALGLRAADDRSEDDEVGKRKASPAFELCTRGLQHWHRRSQGELREAIDLFVRAIEADPGYAHAYGCLALAYAVMPSFAGLSPLDWMPRAKRSAARALELDPDLVEGHMAAGIIAWTYDLDPEAAGRHWSFVESREASNAQVLVWQAYRWSALGEAARSLDCIRKARALDPLSVSVNFDTGLVEWILGEEATGMEQFRRVLVMDPGFAPAAFILGAAHMRRGEMDEAHLAWERIGGFGPAWDTLLAAFPDREGVLAAVDRLVALSPQPVHWYATAVLYTLFGEPERALDWIEAHLRAVRGKPGPLPTGGPGLFLVAREPFFDPLRSTPRFRAIVRALGLPTS